MSIPFIIYIFSLSEKITHKKVGVTDMLTYITVDFFEGYLCINIKIYMLRACERHFLNIFIFKYKKI